MEDKDTQIEYWNSEWKRRTLEGAYLPTFNKEKAKRVCKELWDRPNYFPLEKLEIGCGPGIHALELTRYSPSWGDTWTGLDISEEAVRMAKANGLNAHCVDILDFNANGKKFQVFLLLDVLEHLPNEDQVAERIQQLSQKPYHVFLNVPLYVNAHADSVEKSVNITTIRRFLTLCGCTHMQEHIYGCYGLPYMWAEGVCGA